MFDIWAIVNLSHDSFYPNSRVTSDNAAKTIVRFLEMGADVVDIGAESTRPYSRPISWEDEWTLLKNPLIETKNIIGNNLFRSKISIDTYKTEVAHRAIDLGIRIINDVTGLKSQEMTQLIANSQSKVVIMHSTGNFTHMQVNPHYDNVTREVLTMLRQQTSRAEKMGVLAKNIIWDVGIGFGKSIQHNVELLKQISQFKTFAYPLMIGLSRKSFLGHLFDIKDSNERGAVSLAMHTYLATKKQIDILRVHDVQETVQMRRLIELMTNNYFYG